MTSSFGCGVFSLPTDEMTLLHVFRESQFPHISRKWSEINIWVNPVTCVPGLICPGQLITIGIPKDSSLHKTFIKPTIARPDRTLVCSINDNRIFYPIRYGLQIINISSYTLVHACHTSHIILQITLIFHSATSLKVRCLNKFIVPFYDRHP